MNRVIWIVLLSSIAVLTAVPLGLMVLLMPSADYLPEGKRNFIFGFLVTPPGMGVETTKR